uniref:Histone deacetylase 14 n=1 Tax=Tanacetum cinerariifolium TaxID=118510 RepID=A0A699H2M0_TANCI|nr:hypothetical protein [Tanacetum cinerariifolium]
MRLENGGRIDGKGKPLQGSGLMKITFIIKTKWLMRIFSLLLPQDLMIKYFHLLHGCPLVDETLFILDANLMRDALEITPIDQAHHFVSPPSGDEIMDFVNELGYTEEEFVQDIQTFLTDKANLGSPTKKGRKDKPRVIPYYRFMKLIIYHLGRIHNIHERLTSLFHLAEKDLRLGNLKFVPKGKKDEVFRMPIPNELISNNIRNSPYYSAYMEMVAKHNRRIAAENEGKKKLTTAKQPKPKPTKEKLSKPAPALKPKVTKEKSTKPSPAKKTTMGKVTKVQNVNSSFQLVDEPDEEAAQLDSESEPEYQGEGKGEDQDRQTPAIDETSTGPLAHRHDDTSANIVCDSSSPTDAETEEKTIELDQGQTGLDPSKTLESRPLQEQEFMDEDQARPDPRVSRVALAGPKSKPTHEEFLANVYHDVYGSLKFSADEHVILEEPLSSSTTLSLMKNMDDVSMVTVPIHQASSLIPSLSTMIIDLSPPKPISSYKSLPEHVALYEVVEVSIDQKNKDEFLAEKDMSCKIHRDDQDPSPPLPNSDPTKNKLLWKTGDMGSFITWFCNRIGKMKLKCHRMLTDQVDLVNPKGHRLVPDVSKPLPLGGPPSQLKAAYYLDFGLKELVLSLCNKSERLYDISAAYGISQWWFKRKEFYITRHDAPSDLSQVRSHMRILSVISLKTYERYGYTFLKEIVLHRADYKEYIILEAELKNLHPNEFEDIYLLHLQGQLNHLSGDDRVHFFNAVNLWIRNIVIKKHVEDLQLEIESYQTKLNRTQPD